jgi:hypothetical protein
MGGARVLGCLVVFLVGCTHASTERQAFESRLASRAAVELNCPQSSLRITPSNGAIAGTDIPIFQRVEGCGIHATYEAASAGYSLAYLNGTVGVEKDFGALCGRPER